MADTKAALSHSASSKLEFLAQGFGYDLTLDATVERSAFESWIADDLQKIEDAVDEALGEAKLDARDIDRVFLTGGTSFVPSVRAIFDQRFDPKTIETGDQLESIAYGLALIARTENPAAWSSNSVNN